MGSTCETDVRTELGPTRLPIWTCAIPAIPSTSEVTFVHSRLIPPAPRQPCLIRWQPGRRAWPESHYLIGSWRSPWPLPAACPAPHRECSCQAVLVPAQGRPWRDREPP